MLLNDRNFLGRHFDAQVAARDHDAVGSREDFFQLFQYLRLFQLRDHRGIAAVGANKLLGIVHIAGGTHEG